MSKVEKPKIFESSSSEEDDSDSDKTSNESNDNKQNSEENTKQNNNIQKSIEEEGEKIRRNSMKNSDEDSETTECSNKQKYNKNLQSAETRREDGRGGENVMDSDIKLSHKKRKMRIEKIVTEIQVATKKKVKIGVFIHPQIRREMRIEMIMEREK